MRRGRQRARGAEGEAPVEPSPADARDTRAAAEAFRLAVPLREGEPPFEGPLDLLLHLVKEHEVDVFDIPIARITESYLAALERLRELDVDLAGEFLHMAAQLLLIKSRMLLPRTEVAEDAPPEDAAGDPRAELVRRLLEYQKYKAAAEDLGGRDLLERDVFARRARLASAPAAADGPEGLADVSVFKLVEALDRVMKNARPEVGHEVAVDRLSITDAISRVAEVLKARRRASFEELLGGPEGKNGRGAIIATFLAILEMAKLKLVRVFQAAAEDGAGGEIVVEAKESLAGGALAWTEDYR